MGLWYWSFIGGLAGTLAMDIGARQLGRLGINDALGGLLGRWVLGFRQFRFVIDGKEELKTAETAQEANVGAIFHYFAGGGIALIYPALFTFSGVATPDNYILPGLIFGTLSVGLTWFLQYPCFGFGIFGRKGPEGASTLVPPVILHSLYGLVIGVVLQFTLQ